MATKNMFAQMLNEKPAQALKQKSTIKLKKPPATSEFAFLSGNNLYRHPMLNRGDEVATSAWARMAGVKKPKGVKNG